MARTKLLTNTAPYALIPPTHAIPQKRWLTFDKLAKLKGQQQTAAPLNLPTQANPALTQMPERHKKPIPPPLTIIQANVNKSALAHCLLLEQGFAQRADLILIQEPWTLPDLDRRITKWHPAYDTHPPVADWSNRPRVMSYSLKSRSDLFIENHGITPVHPDLSVLTVVFEEALCAD